MRVCEVGGDEPFVGNGLEPMPISFSFELYLSSLAFSWERRVTIGRQESWGFGFILSDGARFRN